MDFSFENNIILENNRVLLKPLSFSHFEDINSIALKHPNLLQFSPSSFGSTEKTRAYFNAALLQKEKQKRYPFVIVEKQVSRAVGSTSFGNISNHDKRIEIGWTFIDKKLHGSGINKNIKLLMLSYAFEDLLFERVELKTDARNQQSRNAIISIGGQYEGRLRNHTLMQDGFRRDTVYYSILRSEWPGIKKKLTLI